MQADAGVDCAISERASIISSFGWLSLILFCVGLPLLGVCLLWLAKRKDRLRAPRVQRRYGWLFRGYGHDCCWWEVVVTMRKIGVAIAVVFLSAYGPIVQALGVVVVLQMSLVAHLKYRPLCYAEQDALEGLGLTVNLLTVVAGIFFRATHVGKKRNGRTRRSLLRCNRRCASAQRWGRRLRVELHIDPTLEGTHWSVTPAIRCRTGFR